MSAAITNDSTIADGIELDRSEWELVSFGDVALKQRESVDRENTDLTRYIAGEHMGSEDLHLREWGELGEDYLGPAFTRKFSEGDILYGSRRTYLRKVAVAHFDGITANTTFVIKPNEELIRKELLPFVMLSEGFTQHSIRNSKGSVNPYINWKDIANYEFLLPPKDQQAKLAELLWAADTSLNSIGDLSEKAAQLKRSRFAERIGHSSANGKWPSKRLKEFAKIVRGSSPRPAGSPEFFDGDFLPWVTVGLLTYKTTPYLEEHEVPSYLTEKGATKTRIIPPDTVILSNSGFSLGVPSILTFEAGANDGIAAFLELDGLEREYLYYFLASLTDYLRGQIAAGADQPNLNTSRIGSLSIPVPDQETQKGIVAEMLAFDTTINQSNRAMAEQKNLLKSLINQIF